MADHNTERFDGATVRPAPASGSDPRGLRRRMPALSLRGMVPEAHFESVRESHAGHPTPIPAPLPGTSQRPSDPSQLRARLVDANCLLEFAEVMLEELDGAVTADHVGIITYADETACELLGRSVDDLVGNNVFHVLQHAIVPDGSDVLARFKSVGDVRAQTSVERPDGSMKRVRVSLRTICNRQTGVPTSLLLRLIDEDSLRSDGLTGIGNRSEFDRTIAAEIERLQRTGVQLSLLMIDVDHFKKVNDTYGHTAGDRVLQEVAKAINASVRRIDTVARYGGEEIAVLLPGTDADGAAQLAERIRERLMALNIKTGGDVIKVTASIGAAMFSPRDCRMHVDGVRESLWKVLTDRADAALYRAKREGRNRVRVHI